MADIFRGTRHLAFYEALATLDEQSVEWSEAAAGLSALRMIDAWMEEGVAAVESSAWGVQTQVIALEELPSHSVTRTMLTRIREALRDAPPGEMRTVAPSLFAYGRALDIEGHWGQAAVVFHTLISYANPETEADVLANAYFQFAVSQRKLGRTDEAFECYALASAFGVTAHDQVVVLRSQIGAGKIATERGNLPRARALFDDVIARTATDPALQQVHAMALHDRGGVAYRTKQYDEAIVYAYQAREIITDPLDRDRSMSDIASGLMELGAMDAARDAYLIVESTAQEAALRWTARMSLMDIAARCGREAEFDQWYGQLAQATLGPCAEAEFYYYAAKSFESLGHVEEAEAACRRAYVIATEHGFHQIAFDADTVAKRLRHKVPERAAVEPLAHPSAPLAVVISSIGLMRRSLAHH